METAADVVVVGAGGAVQAAAVPAARDCLFLRASTASLCGPVYQGMVRTSVAGAPEARTTARPRSSSARLETSKMRSLPSWRERLEPDLPDETETLV